MNLGGHVDGEVSGCSSATWNARNPELSEKTMQEVRRK